MAEAEAGSLKDSKHTKLTGHAVCPRLQGHQTQLLHVPRENFQTSATSGASHALKWA